MNNINPTLMTSNMIPNEQDAVKRRLMPVEQEINTR